MVNQEWIFAKGVFGMRKIFQAIGKVTIMLMAIVVGICIARFLPLWLGAIIAVCALVCLIINEMEK